MKKNLFLYLIPIYFLAMALSCRLKRDNPYDVNGGGHPIYRGLPKLTTTKMKQITSTSAISGGTITDSGGITISACGVCYSTSVLPTISNSSVSSNISFGTFNCNIAGLNPNTQYYVRAFATNTYGTSYGNLDSFITLKANSPVITTSAVTNIVGTTANCGGNIVSDGGLPIIARGVCFRTVGFYDSTTMKPTLNNASFTTDGSGSGSFTSNLKDLYSGNGNYYVRAYAINAQDTAYGDVQVFFPGSPYVIGQNFGGGLIFSIDNTGNHGLIVAPYDQTTSPVSWGCSGIYVWNVSDPSAMTDSIVSGCSEPNIAAKICKNLTLGGFHDWFLPSTEQLNHIYYYLAYYNLGNFNKTDMNLRNYWSSSQSTSTNAYSLNFNTGYITETAKTVGCNVRACRAF